ncbi:MAG: response regulator [bacterium]|nr:response regulator [bacterium]
MKEPKILVVDDDADIVEVLKLLLEAKGYQVTEAFNGKQGLDKVHEQRPDLVLLDIMMPVMDGWEVCRKLKACKKTADIPVAILTARTEEEDKERAQKEGAADYITKPFKMEDFIRRVEKLLKGSDLSGNWHCVILS